MTRPIKTILLRFVPLAMLAALGLRSQFYYVRRSLGTPGSFVNLPAASGDALLAKLDRLRASPHRGTLVSDTNNVILASLESVYLNPAELQFPAADFFQHPANLDPGSAQFAMSRRLSPDLSAQALALTEARQKMDGAGIFDLKTAGAGPRQDVFFRWMGAAAQDYEVLESGPQFSPLNHRRAARDDVFLTPGASVSNHLIPVVSDLGGSQSVAGRFGPERGVAIYSPEPDYFFAGTMTSLGRYVLFEILHPAPRFRVVLDYTATLNADGENRVPPVDVIGSERLALASTGRGAARLFSPPVTPQLIDGEQYVMLDMGAEPFAMPNRKSGLMTLYGRDVRLDDRRMTGFARDISAISDEEYAAMRAPAELQHFPADLHDPNLEFSGIYEDGWASEDVSAVLAATAGSRLRVRGSIPNLGSGETRITVLLDGAPAAQQNFAAGDFTMESPSGMAAGKHRVEIRSSIARRLAAPDTRRASFLIRRIGFDRSPATGDHF